MNKKIITLFFVCFVVNLFGCENNNLKNLETNGNDNQELLENVKDEVISRDTQDKLFVNYNQKLNLKHGYNVVTYEGKYYFADEGFYNDNNEYGIFEFSLKDNFKTRIDFSLGRYMNIWENNLVFLDNTIYLSPEAIIKKDLDNILEPSLIQYEAREIKEKVGKFRGVDSVTINGDYLFFIEGYISNPSNKNLMKINMENLESLIIIEEKRILDYQIIDETLFVLLWDDDNRQIIKYNLNDNSYKAIFEADERIRSFCVIDSEEILIVGKDFYKYNINSDLRVYYAKNITITDYNIVDDKIIYTSEENADANSEKKSVIVDFDGNNSQLLDYVYRDITVLDDLVFASRYPYSSTRKSAIEDQSFVVLDRNLEEIMNLGKLQLIK